MKDTQKCTKYQEIWLFKANICIEWVKSPLESEYNLLKHVSVQKIFYEKSWSLDPLYVKLTYSIQHFSRDKEKLYVHVGFNLTRSSIFHINYHSCSKWPSGYSVTEFLYPSGPLNDEGSNPAIDFFTFHFFLFELDMPFLIDFKINIFVVILK